MEPSNRRVRRRDPRATVHALVDRGRAIGGCRRTRCRRARSGRSPICSVTSAGCTAGSPRSCSRTATTRPITGRRRSRRRAGIRIDWFDAGVDLLADALAACRSGGRACGRGPTIAPSDSGPGARRNETAVHRWDAQLGGRFGRADRARARRRRDRRVLRPDPVLAARVDRAGHGRDRSICTAPTATASGWSASVPTRSIVTREHAKGDVAARGTRVRSRCCCSAGRIAPSALEVFGDASLLERWQRARAAGDDAGQSGATAVRNTSITCSRRIASASRESGSMSSRPVISWPSERYDSTAP